MNNLQINKVVDKKIKLVKKNTFKNAIIMSASTLAVAGLVMLDNGSVSDATMVGSAWIMFGASSLIYPGLSEISYLKSIKKDLNNGINNFENVSEENFDKVIKPYTKTLY